jgi:hypothetical protein
VARGGGAGWCGALVWRVARGGGAGWCGALVWRVARGGVWGARGMAFFNCPPLIVPKSVKNF